MNCMKFFLKSSNIRKDGFVWNAIAAGATAGQAVLISIFITRCIGIESAGIFSIGYAMGVLFSSLSKYGIRNYQVTDVQKKYSFGEYFKCRQYSIVLTMVIVCILLGGRTVTGQYTLSKAVIVFLLCIWKQIEAVEDVIYGMYQQKGRLDIASKCFAFKQIFTTVVFIVIIVMTKNLLLSSIVNTLITVGVVVLLVKNTKSVFTYQRGAEKEKIIALFKECFALCFSMTASNYICNAPKYIVDRYMNDSMQAYLGYVILPSYFIVMFSGFFFTPLLKELGDMFAAKDARGMERCVYKQSAIVFLLTLIILIGAFFLGMPILTAVYGISDLNQYKSEMLFFIIGSGGYALVVFLTTVLTTIREQGYIALVYVIGLAIYFFAGGYFVNRWQMMGVAQLFLVANICLGVILYLKFYLFTKKYKKDLETRENG